MTPSEQRLHPASILFDTGRYARIFAGPALLALFTSSRGGGPMGRYGDGHPQPRYLDVGADPAERGALGGAVPVVPPAVRAGPARDPLRCAVPERAPPAIRAHPEPGCGAERLPSRAGRGGRARGDRRRLRARGPHERVAGGRVGRNARAGVRGPRHAGGRRPGGGRRRRARGRDHRRVAAPAAPGTAALRISREQGHGAGRRGLRHAVGDRCPQPRLELAVRGQRRRARPVPRGDGGAARPGAAAGGPGGPRPRRCRGVPGSRAPDLDGVGVRAAVRLPADPAW